MRVNPVELRSLQQSWLSRRWASHEDSQKNVRKRDIVSQVFSSEMLILDATWTIWIHELLLFVPRRSGFHVYQVISWAAVISPSHLGPSCLIILCSNSRVRIQSFLFNLDKLSKPKNYSVHVGCCLNTSGGQWSFIKNDLPTVNQGLLFLPPNF